MTSSEQANVDIVEAICIGLSAKDVDAVMAGLGDDATWTIAGRPDRFPFGGTNDKAGSRAVLEGFLGGFSDFEFRIESITAEEDRVAVQATSRGKGPGSATYQNNYLMLFRLRDGKVVDVREYFDQFEVLAYVEQIA